MLSIKDTPAIFTLNLLLWFQLVSFLFVSLSSSNLTTDIVIHCRKRIYVGERIIN